MHSRGLTTIELICYLFILACFGAIVAINWPHSAEGAEPDDPRVPSFAGAYTSPFPAGPWSGTSTHIPSGTGISVVLPPTSDDGTVGQFLDFPRLWQERLHKAAAEISFSLSFAFNSAKIEELGEERLDLVAGIMLVNPELCLSLEGHTDLVGGELYNLELGYQRALSVFDALVARGIEPRRMRPASYRKSVPLQLVLTPSRENRRVELVPYFSLEE